MKLTKFMRDAFISSVMNDVPKIDHDEQAKKLAQDDLLAQMPPKIRAVYNDKELRGFLESKYFSLPGVLQNCYLYGGSINLSAEALEQLRSIAAQKDAQTKQRDGMESRLRSVVYSCTTRKALAEALPEFERYLPADEPAAVRSLPVVAGVVPEFRRAGWPAANDRKAKKAA